MALKVVGIGEVLWDLLPSGPQLGGAPANFACHARQLGADVQVVTRVGNDPYGRRILHHFEAMGIDGSAVQMDDRLPTGTATVLLDNSGTPQFTITDNVAWDALSFTEHAVEAVQSAHAICFGTLAQRNRAAAGTIQQLVAAAPSTSLRVFDVNLRQKFYTREVVEQSLQIANVLKLNELELAVLSEMFGFRGSERGRIERLAKECALEVVALTRGDKGSSLYQGGNWSDMPSLPMEIVDTIGAGDAFAAALVMGLLHGLSLQNTHHIAAEVARYVCSCAGATPALPARLSTAFASDRTGV